MNRYVTICFRDDEVDRWTSFKTLEEADAAVVGIDLCDNDSRTGLVYDLQDAALLVDADEWDEEWHGPKAASATDAMKALVAAFR